MNDRPNASLRSSIHDQLLGELDEINNELSGNLDLDNLGGKTCNGSASNTDEKHETTPPASYTEKYESSVLDEFTQAVCEEAESLASVYFGEDAHQPVPQESIEQLTEQAAEKIRRFSRDLLSEYLTITEPQA